jgi:hypothetical protein
MAFTQIQPQVFQKGGGQFTLSLEERAGVRTDDKTNFETGNHAGKKMKMQET